MGKIQHVAREQHSEFKKQNLEALFDKKLNMSKWFDLINRKNECDLYYISKSMHSSRPNLG